MRRILKLFASLLGLLALAALVMVLVTTFRELRGEPQAASQLFQSPIQSPTPPRATPTPPQATPTPPRATPTPELPVVPWPTAPPYTPPPGWVNVTLDQIQFGQPTVVFTSTQLIKIIQWLPDNRRLLLELGVGNARMITLDTTSGDVAEYAYRPENDIAPVWVDKANGIAYQFCPSNRPCEVRFTRAAQEPRTLAEGGTRLAVHHPTGRILVSGPRTPLLAIDPLHARRVAPPVVIPRAPERAPFFVGRWSDYVSVDPRGRWLAHVWGDQNGIHVDVVDIGGRGLRTVRIWDREMEMLSGEGGFRWRPGATVWSPGGRYMAVIMEGWVNLLMVSRVAIVDPENGTWRWLDLPSRFVDEVDWAPDGRHMLIVGADLATGEHMNTLWVVDTMSGNYRRPNELPQGGMLVPGWSIAWAQNGKLLAIFGGIPNANAVLVTKVSISR